MQAGFSSFIVIFTVLNILACFWLLWWNRRRPEDAGKETTGHVWDEDIREYNKPMPRWWLNMFVLSIVWGLAYLIAYPGLGAYSGALAWSSVQEHAQATAEIDGRIAQAFSPYHNAPLTQLMNDPAALKLGQSIYVNTCAACHGADARGAPGFPDLTDNDWLYGGEPDVVLTSVLGGRAGLMPSWETALGEAGVAEVTAYVRQLSGQAHNAEQATAGGARYQMFCLSCHGVDGKGNTALGAPNLTDDVWLYGGTEDAIAVSVRKGRQGQMPAHGDLIGEDRARVVAAYVLSLSNKSSAGQDDAGSGAQESSAGQDDAGSGAQEISAGQEDADSGAQESSPDQGDAGSGAQESSAGQDDAGSGAQESSAGQDDAGSRAQESSAAQDDADSGAQD